MGDKAASTPGCPTLDTWLAVAGKFWRVLATFSNAWLGAADGWRPTPGAWLEAPAAALDAYAGKRLPDTYAGKRLPDTWLEWQLR